MTKQEEIRKVIDTYTDDGCLYPTKTCMSFKGNYCISDDGSYTCLMERLAEIGVVIKVDRELPTYWRDVNAQCCESCHFWEQQNMLKAGYTAVEPLT